MNKLALCLIPYLSLLVKLILSAGLAGAQQVSSEIPSIAVRTTTRLVVVDVVVTDKQGKPVTGLKAQDFNVEEGGKNQRIATFSPPSSNIAGPQPLPSGFLTNQPVYIKPAGVPTVLLLDVANSHFLDQAYGRTQMLKYVLEQGSDRPMAVMVLSDKLHVLQNFTTDPTILATAIRHLQPRERIPEPSMSFGPSAVAGGPSMGRAPATGSAVVSAIAAAQAQLNRFKSIRTSYDLEGRTLITIQALRDLSRMLGGLSGRKNVVWLTDDFPFDLIPENTSMSDAELRAELAGQGRERSAEVNSLRSLVAQPCQRYAAEIRDAQYGLASACIAIYPVDMRGITGDLNVNLTSGLRELAAETGGRAYISQNEIRLGIALAASDEKASYSVGYYPENGKWDGTFRTIKVKANCDGCEVRHRTGYFAQDLTQAKNVNYEPTVAHALESETPATQVSFMARAKPTDPGKMRVVFLVDAHTLSSEDSPNGKKLNVSLYAAVYDSAGKMLGSRWTDVNNVFDGATYQQIVEKGMMVPLDMDMPANGKELRLAVLDNRTGLIGTANGTLGQ